MRLREIEIGGEIQQVKGILLIAGVLGAFIMKATLGF